MPNDEITHIGELRPDPKNARKHTPRNVGTIVDALHEVGAARSIVIDEDNIILAGNATIEAAAQAGIERVRVVDADGDEIIAVRRSGLTGKQKTRLALYDNRAAEHAEWDTDVLGALGEEGALDGLFYEDELAALLGTVEPQVGAGGDEFDTTPDDGPTRVQPGDVWRIGPHRLMCGDSTNPLSLDVLLAGAKPDVIWADPPYGMEYEPNHDDRRVKHGYNGAGYHNVKAQSMIEGDDEPFDPSFLMEHFRGVREQFWWGADYYAERIPDRLKGSWIAWDKRAGIEDMNFNTSHFELCWSKSKHLREIIRVKWFGIQGTERQDIRNRVHPTQKPIQVPMEQLEKHSKKGALVFDPFLGSGTTLIAANRTGRRCYGMEIAPRYCDVVLRRAEAEGIGPIELVDNSGQ